MRRCMILLVLMSLGAPVGMATVMKPRLLSDRMAEADLVLVASTGPTSVYELVSVPTGGRRYVALASLAVSEVIRGTGAPGSLAVALAAPTATQLMAQIHAEAVDADSAVWILREAEPGGPVPFEAVFRSTPELPSLLEPYVDPFRTSAQSMQPFEPIDMELTLPPGPFSLSDSISGQVRLFTGLGQMGILPAAFAWDGNVSIVLEPDEDPYEFVPRRPDASAPLLGMLSITGTGGPTISSIFPLDTSEQADVEVLAANVEFEGPSAEFYCVARLVDDDGKTLIQAPRVKRTFTSP